MIAIAVSRHGGPEVLRAVERPTPEPGRREVLIRVEGAGVNRPDLMQREGRYPPPAGASDIPGLEVAGTVAACGPDVQRWREGDRVCALVSGGGYAEFCVAPDVQCLPIPSTLETVSAAGVPEAFFTVWMNVFDRGRLQPGESLLVHGGASGIGTTAIQMAHALGARVFATADFAAALKPLTDDRGIDVILDMIGAPYFARNIDLLAVEGRLLQIAVLHGAKAEINLIPVLRRRLTISGSVLRARRVEEKGAIAAALELRVWPLVEQRKIAPVIFATVPLSEAAEAHRLMESGVHIGKIVLAV
jgi:NADPH:quinone reductase-like Zn-dependent oxidoreductase